MYKSKEIRSLYKKGVIGIECRWR